VFDSLFKTLIPEELFKIIKQDIIESKIIRKEARWIYSFSENENGKMNLKLTTHYQLHNVSRQEVTDPIKMDFYEFGGTDYQLLSAECVTSKSKVPLIHYEAEKPSSSENVLIEKTEKRTSISYTITVPPNDFVEYTVVATRNYVGDILDFHFNKIPVINAELFVNIPKGYIFEVIPQMSSDMKLISESEEQRLYRVKGGILPRQGFVFSLNPSNKKNAIDDHTSQE
jgi:hypothetical protein